MTWQQEKIKQFSLDNSKFCNIFIHFQLSAIQDKCAVCMVGGLRRQMQKVSVRFNFFWPTIWLPGIFLANVYMLFWTTWIFLCYPWNFSTTKFYDFITWIVIPIWCFTSAVMEELRGIWSTNPKILLTINQTWMGAQSKFWHINLWREKITVQKWSIFWADQHISIISYNY